MPIEETIQEREIRLKNLNHARNALSTINHERVKARFIFEKLLPGQKKLLLQASGINRTLSTINHLSDCEVELLNKGLLRIQLIIKAFNSCTDDDFKTNKH